jgi:hypothetical protein
MFNHQLQRQNLSLTHFNQVAMETEFWNSYAATEL